METQTSIDRQAGRNTGRNRDESGTHDEGGKLTIDDFKGYLSRLTGSGVDRTEALAQARRAVRLYYPGPVRTERIKLMTVGSTNPELVKEAEHQLDQHIEVAIRGAIQPVSAAQKRE